MSKLIKLFFIFIVIGTSIEFVESMELLTKTVEANAKILKK